MLKLSRGIDALNARFGILAEWLTLAAVLVSAGNAAVRYLFNYSSNALLEIQWYLFGGAVFLGAALTLRMNEHVRVDLIYSSVSERMRLWIDIFGLSIFLLPSTIFLGWLCWPMFLKALESGEMSSSYGGLILWPVLLVFPLGFALLTLQGLSELIKRIAALRGAIILDTHYEQPLQ